MTVHQGSQEVRHILSVSGGKDSAALAIYLRDRIPGLEYAFCDTEKELPETYEYLMRLEAYLGRPIVRLRHDGRGFDHWLKVFANYLPSPGARWCTRHLKLRPFERYVGDASAINYVGIRADEDREGYISRKPNITARYPFREDGISYGGVMNLLREAGIGLPDYYRWRSRSGCYFCFFQQKIEWVGLHENHPDLYVAASQYEGVDPKTGTRFTWSERESLEELARPARIEQIRAEFERRTKCRSNVSLAELFEEDDEDRACLICSL